MDKPPISFKPADLLMILETGVTMMNYVKKNSPGDYIAVVSIAEVTKTALDYWLELATEMINGKSV